MKPVLILYATRQGQTRRIAEFVAAAIGRTGLATEVLNVATLPDDFDLTHYASAVLAASVNYGKHQPEMVAFIKANRATLELMRTSFLSVSGAQGGVEDPESSAASRDRSATTVKSMIDVFVKQTGWSPGKVVPVGGAMRYQEYGWLLKLAIRVIAWASGTKIDTSRNTEYTNWQSLERFCEEFSRQILDTPAGSMAA